VNEQEINIHWQEQPSPVPGGRCFRGQSNKSNGLAAIVDTLTIDGKQWRHLSVSRRSRTPSHEDMMLAADAFLDRDHVVLSIYPRRAEWVNLHNFCLHLWQPIGFDPVPDPKMERARSVGWMTPEERVEFEAWKAAGCP
jgi:hypothetical protein